MPRILAGEPARTLPDAVETFILYAIFSLVGWMLVGLPATLLFPARSITRLSWPRALIVGATSGPIALLVIFALLSRSHIYFRNLAEVSTLLRLYNPGFDRFFYGLPGLAAQRNEEQSEPGHDTSSIGRSGIAGPPSEGISATRRWKQPKRRP